MDEHRFQTKMAVNRRQLVWFPAMRGEPAGYYPACALCGGKHPADLHEVWITKYDVQGNQELWQKINAEPLNTVILHNHPCHIPLAEENRQRERFQMILVDLYGKQPIIDWINALGLKNPGEYVHKVLAVPDKQERGFYENFR